MKPQTYFSLALLFPYILWCLCVLIFFLVSSQEIPAAWNVALMPISFYTFGIILWFIPYTILAVGMWIWSRNKSTKTLYKLVMLAPVLLSVLMLIEVVLVSLPVGSVTELTKDLPSQAALVGGFSLVFGYLCVGIAFGVFKFLQGKHLIVEEMNQLVSEANQATTLT